MKDKDSSVAVEEVSFLVCRKLITDRSPKMTSSRHTYNILQSYNEFK